MRVPVWNDQKVAVVVFQIRSTSSTGISPQSWISRLALDLGPWTLDLGSQWQLQFTKVNMIWITTFWVVRFPTCYWKINIILSLQFTRWRCGTSRNGSLGFRLPQGPFLTLSNTNTGLYCKAGLLDCPGTFGGSCNISTHQVKKYGDWVWKTQVQCVIRS